MMHIPNIQEIEQVLLQVSGLMDRYAAKDPSFTTSALKWFLEIESTLQKNRLALAAEVASMRGAVISAQRDGSTVLIPGSRRTTRRRKAENVAEQMIRTTVELVSKRISQDSGLISKAEESTFELVIVGRQLKLIPLEVPAPFHSSMLLAMWEALSAHEVTAKYTTYVSTIVGKSDALILLDRVLGK